MKGSIKRYCTCKDENGKVVGVTCPQLSGDSKHGQWEFRERLTTARGERELRRRGFVTKKAAAEFRARVAELVGLAKGDRHALGQLGDLVFESTSHGAQLPNVDVVRRRLALGGVIDRSETTGEWLHVWLANKARSRRASTVASYTEHVTLYLDPALGEIPLYKLAAQHIHGMFDTLDERNAEIEAAKREGRSPKLDGDMRRLRRTVVGPATQRRIFGTLRNSLNAAWRARKIDANPCNFVELAAEESKPSLVWSPEQVRTFLAFTQDDRLHLLWRMALLHGLRRGELTGMDWAGLDLDERTLTVTRTVLSVAGKVQWGKPKTRSGRRVVDLDRPTVDLLRRHSTQQKRDRLAWDAAWDDNDLVFPREDGSPMDPGFVTRRFASLCTAAKLPQIRLHDARHTAATMALEAGVDVKIVSERLGHANTGITQNTYQHVRRAVHRGAVDQIVSLIEPDEQGGQSTAR